MISLVRAVLLFGKSSGAAWQMRAHVAEHSLRSVAGAIETREEARLPDCDVVRGMKTVRDWTFNNDLRRPTSADNCYAFLADWKTHRQHEKECGFLMRHVPWWRSFSDYSSVKSEVTTAASAALLDGYGLKEEPLFAGKKNLKVGAHGSLESK
eukprot:6256158-Prymnesium_polylepis.1